MISEIRHVRRQNLDIIWRQRAKSVEMRLLLGSPTHISILINYLYFMLIIS